MSCLRPYVDRCIRHFLNSRDGKQNVIGNYSYTVNQFSVLDAKLNAFRDHLFHI